MDQTKHTPKKSTALFPIILAAMLIGGIYVGNKFAKQNTSVSTSPTGKQTVNSEESNPKKLVHLINFIEENYVDSVDKAEIINEAITHILEDLDPHSGYSSPEQTKASDEQLSGAFFGIGIEFMLLRDSLVVIDPIADGPSMKAGLKPADRIVEVDNVNVTGDTLTNDLVMSMLKGSYGSEVNIKVKRKGESELLPFVISRGEIPIESVVTDYMVDETTGYVKLIRFARTTGQEFDEALNRLRKAGAKQFIVDLRNNGGGFLSQAISVAEEFLERNDLIVFTEGLHQGKNEDFATRTGRFHEFPVSILINESSASASEIVAGALQDHDRALIVGRRSFGKGLVQNPLEFSDRSSIRLTIARYYTPSGRCIQKPYGDGIEYENDYLDRYNSGELFSQDSISLTDTVKYYTTGNRVVYGGGGITPDVFIPLDTSYSVSLLNEIAYTNLVRQFAFDYADKNRKTVSYSYNDALKFSSEFKLSDAEFNEFLELVSAEEIEYTAEDLASSRAELELRISAQIGKYIFGDEAFYRTFNRTDEMMEKAIQNINKDLKTIGKK